MRPLTFTQKLLRQRNFLASLIPLFALFVGLGASQTAQAQNITSSNYFIGRGNPTVNTTFGGSSAITPNFNNANLGSFDINSPSTLLLNGGEVVFEAINNQAANAPNDVVLRFRIQDAALNTVAPFEAISLTRTAVSSNNRVYTYRLDNASRSLIALVTASGSYRIQARFEVSTPNDPITADAFRAATFTVTGTPVTPTGLTNSNIFINTVGELTPNTIYGGSSGTAPLFQGTNLGSYDINNGELTLNGGNVTTFERTGDDIQNPRLVYRIQKPVQPGNTSVINFAPSNIALVQLGTPTSQPNGTSRVFSNATALRNLIATLAGFGAGEYTITVSFEADLFTNTSFVGVITDPRTGGYTARFVTTGVPFPTNTWEGLRSDDWFDGRNWSLRSVPTNNTNVIVPNYLSGAPNLAPNIRATAATGPARARNLDLQGSSQAERSILRLITGRFIVSGSFFNRFDTFIQRTGTPTLASVIEFSSPGNSQISGGNFTSVEISGGGRKALTGIMNIDAELRFAPNGGILSTDVSRPLENVINLGERSVLAPNGAQLVGESETAYVRGFMETVRSDVRVNELDPVTGQIRPRTYGNMGMTINFKGPNNPGNVRVTRNTAESYTPLAGPLRTERFGIRRIFGVRPSNESAVGGLLADLTFRYRDAELINLGPQGNGSIAEPNLALFVSTSGGNQFGALGSDALDQTANILTKNNVTVFATFTLGDRTNPLPVTLTAFDAKRTGTNVLLTWDTAIELNNKGFYVQVSTDGKQFRTIGFVASEAPNSTRLRNYSYIDTEENKAGQRYYRLRQVDLDGKEAFFGPRSVSFEGKALAAALTAYPNPLGNADKLYLTVQSPVSGQGRVSITDMTGRVVSQQQIEIIAGSTDAAVNGLNDLKGGLYMVRLVLPNGEVQNLKVQK
ncbi:T9SS type A sorting domain-containing protein [Hymenobacter arizonensis]|uniref:Por secretion system C-terminal sorting domain-containing protein n=1 Tax=Hymenobacter arizonensis TaxID=1227077 RepID=A0A1I5WS39_HYMAR|nr:T9SS type A sorting domain-containing protein [Hymenobacter arizonensis]SFQ22592.1 Por secretion system C-terminal sorting domain-containing protein [Hymenobacter arizonensis]